MQIVRVFANTARIGNTTEPVITNSAAIVTATMIARAYGRCAWRLSRWSTSSALGPVTRASAPHDTSRSFSTRSVATSE